MKITKRQLRRVIREEKRKLTEQPVIPDVMGAIGGGKFQPREVQYEDPKFLELVAAFVDVINNEGTRRGYSNLDIEDAFQAALTEVEINR